MFQTQIVCIVQNVIQSQLIHSQRKYERKKLNQKELLLYFVSYVRIAVSGHYISSFHLKTTMLHYPVFNFAKFFPKSFSLAWIDDNKFILFFPIWLQTPFGCSSVSISERDHLRLTNARFSLVQFLLGGLFWRDAMLDECIWVDQMKRDIIWENFRRNARVFMCTT